MPLKYSDKPSLHYGGSPRANVFGRFPAHSQPMSTAPTLSGRPVKLYEANGASKWGFHHNNKWMQVERYRDPRTGTYSVRSNGVMINPVRWASS